MNIDAKILIILITNINSIQQYVKRITECEYGLFQECESDSLFGKNQCTPPYSQAKEENSHDYIN